MHLAVVNKGTLDTQFNIADGAKNVDLASSEEKQLVQPLDPGQHFVLCSVEGGTFTQAIEVVDPNGYWFDPDPDCSADQSKSGTSDSDILQVEGDPLDEMVSSARSIFESSASGSALEGGYEIRTGGYPVQDDLRSIVAVDDQGHVIGVVWFMGHGTEWYPSSYVTCDASVIF